MVYSVSQQCLPCKNNGIRVHHFSLEIVGSTIFAVDRNTSRNTTIPREPLKKSTDHRLFQESLKSLVAFMRLIWSLHLYSEAYTTGFVRSDSFGPSKLFSDAGPPPGFLARPKFSITGLVNNHHITAGDLAVPRTGPYSLLDFSSKFLGKDPLYSPLFSLHLVFEAHTQQETTSRRFCRPSPCHA